MMLLFLNCRYPQQCVSYCLLVLVLFLVRLLTSQVAVLYIPICGMSQVSGLNFISLVNKWGSAVAQW